MTKQQFLSQHGTFITDLRKGLEIQAGLNGVWLIKNADTRQVIMKAGFNECWEAFIEATPKQTATTEKRHD